MDQLSKDHEIDPEGKCRCWSEWAQTTPDGQRSFKEQYEVALWRKAKDILEASIDLQVSVKAQIEDLGAETRDKWRTSIRTSYHEWAQELEDSDYYLSRSRLLWYDEDLEMYKKLLSEVKDRLNPEDTEGQLL